MVPQKLQLGFNTFLALVLVWKSYQFTIFICTGFRVWLQIGHACELIFFG